MLDFKFIKKRNKTEEEAKREAVSKLASEQLQKIINFGGVFPVIDYKI